MNPALSQHIRNSSVTSRLKRDDDADKSRPPSSSNAHLSPPLVNDAFGNCLASSSSMHQGSTVGMSELEVLPGLMTNSSCDSLCCQPLRYVYGSVRHRAKSLFTTGRMTLSVASRTMSSSAMSDVPDESLLMLLDDTTFSHQLAMHAETTDVLVGENGEDMKGGQVRLITPPLDSVVFDDAIFNAKTLYDWDFNPFIYSHAALVRLTVEFLKFCSPNKLGNVPIDRIFGLVNSCKDLYFDNFYHGFAHGVCVMGVVGLMIGGTNAGRAITDDEAAAALIGGLLHDVGHPGANNEFSVKRGARVALTFVSSSVLESLHASIATELVTSHGLLDAMGAASANSFRQAMVAAILATDMTRHSLLNEFLSKSGLKEALHMSEEDLAKQRQEVEASSTSADCALRPFSSPTLNIASKLSPGMRELTVQHLVKAGDLSNPVLSTPLCVEWAKRICLEFALQSEAEKALGLEPNPMLGVDPRWRRRLALSQKGFINFVVKPYWLNLHQTFGKLEKRVEQLETNIIFWDSEEKKGLKEEQEEEERKAVAAAEAGGKEA
eukprot:GDKJ01013377.1.p1 GENE.GDKJ01013377.1~~GDKJ01013377.1.p1  ORF type:complete len:550 (+),score=142.31 GDKJ01013377.1:1201-2850(+)